MAQKRQRQGGFRFSLPWITSQAAAQPTSRSTPAQRQSPRVSSLQNSNQQQTPPPRAPPSKQIETQKPSPSRASTQPRIINSQTPSPSHVGTQSHPTSKNPSGDIPESKPTLRATPKAQSQPNNNFSTTIILNKIEKNKIAPKREIQAKEDEGNHKLNEKSEEKAIKGKEILQEHNDSKDKHFPLSTGSKEPNFRQEHLASDNKQTHVEGEGGVSTKDTLNCTNSPDAYPKTIISDVLDKDRARIYHHKNDTSSENKPIHKGIQDDISKFVQKMTNEHQNLSLDEKQISVVTLTGDNRGASMTISHESGKKEGKINIYRGYKINKHESRDSTTEGEKSSKEESSEDSKIQEDEEQKTYINSNIQSVNNSIMFNSSITERDPGVHITMSHSVMERLDETKSNEQLETHKAKFSVSQSQKLSYKPVVRRRCLKGLFMEPSDSDPDNPDKPRRHGCRVACGEKSSKNKFDTL